MRQSGYNLVGDRVQQSCLEVQASMPDFSLSESVEDGMDLIIELGFVMFFGNVAPEIIWLFCASNLIRIRAWGWKLLFAVRRPFPAGSPGLGTLNKVVGLMSVCSVWCNILLCMSLNLQYRSARGDVLTWLEDVVGSVPAKGTDLVEEANWRSMLAVFLVLERTLFLARGFIDYCILHSSHPVEIEEKRRDAMITAYYKLIIEDAKVQEQQGMTEATVEALVPVLESPALSPREWQPVGVEQILRACSELHPEAQEATVPPFTLRDPGFEAHWDEQDGDGDAAQLPMSACCSLQGSGAPL